MTNRCLNGLDIFRSSAVPPADEARGVDGFAPLEASLAAARRESASRLTLNPSAARWRRAVRDLNFDRGTPTATAKAWTGDSACR